MRCGEPGRRGGPRRVGLVHRAPGRKIQGRAAQWAHPPGAQVAVEHVQRAAGQDGERRLGEDGQPIAAGGRPAQQLLQAVGQRAAALDPRWAEGGDVDDGQPRCLGLAQHRVDHGR